MPADRDTSGTGRRRQGKAAAERPDEHGRTIERALDREREMGAVDTVHDRGRQPGAHGRQGPHRDIKPGTRRAIEEANIGRGGQNER